MDYIITIPIADDVWTDEVPRPQPSVLMNTNGIQNAYLTTTTEGWPVSRDIVGMWDEYSGEPLGAIAAAYNDWIRPLGNDNGMATGFLDSMRWQGHSEPKFIEFEQPDPELPPTVAERYPDYRRPFTLQIERTFITDDGFPQIPHGWKVTMLSEDPLRDITARAIGIYNDSGGYLYTTGAFIDDGTGTYFTECPVGQRTADEVQINFKLLLGSAPEGAWVLPVGDEGDARQFWADDQQPSVMDIDGDGNPDVRVDFPGSRSIGSPRITSDDDSINIDIDGDGDADIVIPKP